MNLSRADAFAGLVRTRSTNIIGFVELLTDERLGLPPGRRAEYAGIVLAEIAALDRDMRAYLRGTSAPPN